MLSQTDPFHDGIRYKRCSKCERVLAVKEFYKGHGNTCKACSKNNVTTWREASRTKYRLYARKNLCKRHGITIEIYDRLFNEQNGVCANCKKPETARNYISREVIALNIDHDHRCCPGTYSCGKCVRGLLCWQCNQMEGRTRGDVTLLYSLASYLTSPPPSWIAEEINKNLKKPQPEITAHLDS